MFRYNKLLKLVSSYSSDSDNNSEESNDGVESNDLVNDKQIMYDIQHKNETAVRPENILDSIIQHPFMENITTNTYASLTVNSPCREKIRLIVYRINTYKENNVVEFYLISHFLSTDIDIGDNIATAVNNTLQHVVGTKRLSGYVMVDNIRHVFVQVRNNRSITASLASSTSASSSTNWLTIWDIIVNKHYFGEKIDQNVVDFFTANCEISNLIINRRLCIKPIVLYSYADKSHTEYIKKHNSIQYCQRENDMLIKLNQYKNGDNIRSICFIEDAEFSDTYGGLRERDFIIMNSQKSHIAGNQDQEQESCDNDNDNNIRWIFKNERNIFSHIK
jgi:hypothetical protein